MSISNGLKRAAATLSLAVAFGVGSIGSFEVTSFGVPGIAISLGKPAQARCLVNGVIRHDIPSGDDCLEAQRTGCVRHLLTDEQFIRCSRENKAALNQGRTCVLGGVVRNDLSAVDCEEAKATGCVRRLLSGPQYRACLDAQRH
jgi:hypothetical protein